MQYKTQNAFMAGEISPAMYGRFDDKKYQQGLSLCRNFIPRPQGPVHNRSGFEFVARTKFADRPCRLLPFQFSHDQTMVIELGDKYARFHTNGQTLVTEDGTPYEIETPYCAKDVMELHYVQAADVVTIVHTAYPPHELRRYGATDWRLVPVSFSPALEAPKGLEGSFKIVNKPNYTLKDEEKFRYEYKYKVTAVKTSRGRSTLDNEESEPSESVTVKGNMYLDNATVTIQWNAVAGAERYRIYRSYKGLYAFIGEATDPTFTDDNYKTDQEWTPPVYDDPFAQNKGIKSVTVIDGGEGYFPRSVRMKNDPAVTLGEEKVTEFLSQLNLKEFYRDSGSWLTLTTDAVKEKHKEYLIFASRTFTAFGPEGESEIRDFVLENVPIEDVSGAGRDAVATLRFKQQDYSSSQEKHGTRVKRGTVSVLYAVEITNRGVGYSAPRIKVSEFSYDVGDYTFSKGVLGGEGYSNRKNTEWDVGLYAEKAFHLRVDDATGNGAVLDAVTDEQGSVTSVQVRYGGRGYTSPTLSLPGGTRPATFSATIADVGDYPGAVAYFEQRRVFAGTRGAPQTLWMTRTGTESDMTYTLPVKDDNRIKFRIAAQEASRIQHVVPLSQLVVLTEGTEFRATSVNSDAITPSSFAVKPQSYIGASSVQPVIVNSAMVYAASRGGHLRELGYSKQQEGFTSGDLSLRASHLFERTEITSLALQKAPDNIVWATQSDGKLLGFTYLPDQGIGGWHRHETVNGTFECVTCVSEGKEDIVYVVTQRHIKGERVRYIERMHESANGELVDSFFVDCGATYEGKPTKTISGLHWLEGQTVAILADGAVTPKQEVKDGAIELLYPARKVHVGLPILAEIETLPVIFPVDDGSYALNRKKNVADVYANVFESASFSAGTCENSLVETKPRDTEPYGTPPRLTTGQIALATTTGWGVEGKVLIRQPNPLPLEITSLTWRFMT